MARQPYIFTPDTLAKMRAMKAADDQITKKEVCAKLRVTLTTLNKAADRAELRAELSALFPPHTTIERRTDDSVPFASRIKNACACDLQLRWLTGNWSAQK